MKKILIISAVFPPEPVVSANLSFDIANELGQYNDVTVISPYPTRPKDFKFLEFNKENFNFKHVVANSYTCAESKIIGRMKESYSFGKFCECYIKDNYKSIDIIYQNSWPLLSQFLIFKSSKKYNIPLITHVMDIYPESLIEKIPLLKKVLYNLLLPIDKKVLDYSTINICISENMKDYLSKSRKISKDKFIIVNNWQDESEFIKFRDLKTDISNKKEPFTFMYLGNNGPVAGVELIIESFVYSNIKNSRLIIAGSGSRTIACKDLVSKLNANNVFFVDVPRGKVPEIQSLADVMVLPVKKGASFTSIPSKLPAYMFSEKPIIGCLDHNSDTANAILSANAGWVVEPENINKLSEIMILVAKTNSEKLKLKGHNGFIYSLNNFSKNENLKKITNILLKSINNEG
ncbi:glycosyltransferase WbuB [Paenimyroides tangerinum]|uniref:Glycosyltransferase WbuB n=1 Tax=Paenimyroides tangerinum TaxID=2488728 RepID=A0A3P3W544_9FLAO|nr:glycosyltransferase family 4 protein [Paenimyroides tangerinum]RRJ89568.1 glycosyltransferase WbuB [Paenimyroides tangerinum]